jgi:hypothetical protein
MPYRIEGVGDQQVALFNPRAASGATASSFILAQWREHHHPDFALSN